MSEFTQPNKTVHEAGGTFNILDRIPVQKLCHSACSLFTMKEILISEYGTLTKEDIYLVLQELIDMFLLCKKQKLSKKKLFLPKNTLFTYFVETFRLVAVCYCLVGSGSSIKYGASVYLSPQKVPILPCDVKSIKHNIRQTALERFNRFPVICSLPPLSGKALKKHIRKLVVSYGVRAHA